MFSSSYTKCQKKESELIRAHVYSYSRKVSCRSDLHYPGILDIKVGHLNNYYYSSTKSGMFNLEEGSGCASPPPPKKLKQGRAITLNFAHKRIQLS